MNVTIRIDQDESEQIVKRAIERMFPGKLLINYINYSSYEGFKIKAKLTDYTGDEVRAEVEELLEKSPSFTPDDDLDSYTPSAV